MPLNSVVETWSYLRDAEGQLTENQRAGIVNSLAADPLQGVLIKGTGGLRKMRIAASGRGKRGGGRIVYWFHSEGYPIVLLAMFAKNEAADLSAAERIALVKIADRLMEQLGGRG
jgi:hypothetical protein